MDEWPIGFMVILWSRCTCHVNPSSWKNQSPHLFSSDNPRRIPSFPDSFNSWNSLSSIGSGITFLSFRVLFIFVCPFIWFNCSKWKKWMKARIKPNELNKRNTKQVKRGNESKTRIKSCFHFVSLYLLRSLVSFLSFPTSRIMPEDIVICWPANPPIF